MRDDRTNPFPGLRPFAIDEGDLFFGRVEQVDELLLRLERARFTAVVGTSGSGKSSLVRAGLLSALKRGHMTDAGSRWRIVVFRPIDDPIGNLARELASEKVFPLFLESNQSQQVEVVENTLRRSSLGLIEATQQASMKPGENLLIVVDQFEELFRFEETFRCDNPADEASAFVNLLLEAARQREVPIYLVLTMRSDYLGESIKFAGLAQAINEGLYLVPPMSDEDRRAAITAPAAKRGAQITKPLVSRLLNDVGDNPDKLPSLQHALMRTWDKWEGREKAAGEPLGILDYEATGALEKALSNHANEAFAKLSGKQQKIAERIFKALTAKGPDGRGTRSPRKFAELCEIAATEQENPEDIKPDVRDVIEAFSRKGRSFLMLPPDVSIDDETQQDISPETLIDISHETLIQGWDKLGKWVEEEADSARAYQRLAEHAVRFDNKLENLLEPPALPSYVKWWKKEQQPNEAWAGRYFNPNFGKNGFRGSYKNEFQRSKAFLDESEAAYAKEVERKEKEAKRRLRNLTVAVASLALLLLLATGAGVIAGVQWRRANSALLTANAERERAERAEKTATDRLAETQRQKQVAVEAQEEAERQSGLAKESEQRANASRETAVREARKAELASAEAIKQKKNADIEGAKAVASANEAKENAERLKAANTLLDKKNEELAEANKNLGVRNKTLYDTLRELENQRAFALESITEAEGTLSTLGIVDSQTPNLNAISRQQGRVVNAVFGSDNNLAFASTDYGTAQILRFRNNSPEFTQNDFKNVLYLVNRLKRLNGPSYRVNQLLSKETKDLLQSYKAPDQPDPTLVSAIVSDFNSLLKGPSVYDKEDFKNVRLRNSTRELLDKKNPSSEELMRLNRKLLEDAYSAELTRIEEFDIVNKYTEGYRPALSPDGSFVAMQAGFYTIDLYDQEKVILREIKSCDCYISSVSFSATGKYLWSTGRKNDKENTDHLLFFWTTDQGASSPQIEIDVKRPIASAVLSPNEKDLAITFPDSTEIQIWDIQTAAKVRSLTGSEQLLGNDSITSGVESNDNTRATGPVNSVSYNRDGTLMVATFKNHKNVRIWEVANGKLKYILSGHQCQVNSAEFNYDGNKVVSASDDGSAIAWDLGKGEKYELRGYSGWLVYRRRGINEFWQFPFGFTRNPKEGEFVPLNTAKFSRDGKMVVTASVDGQVRVYPMDKDRLGRNEYLKLPGFTGNVSSAEFSPNQRFVIAGGDDGAVRIWNIPILNTDDNDRSTKPPPKSCDTARELKRSVGPR